MAERSGRKASPLQQRASRLLSAGVIGGHLALAVCVVAFAIARGSGAAVWSLLAGLVTLVFFTIGQGIQVLVADADPKVVLGASLASFGLRAGGLGALLWWSQENAVRIASMDPWAVAVTAIAVVMGWLAAELRAFTKLRIPAFDPPSDQPD